MRRLSGSTGAPAVAGSREPAPGISVSTLKQLITHAEPARTARSDLTGWRLRPGSTEGVRQYPVGMVAFPVSRMAAGAPRLSREDLPSGLPHDAWQWPGRPSSAQILPPAGRTCRKCRQCAAVEFARAVFERLLSVVVGGR